MGKESDFLPLGWPLQRACCFSCRNSQRKKTACSHGVTLRVPRRGGLAGRRDGRQSEAIVPLVYCCGSPSGHKDRPQARPRWGTSSMTSRAAPGILLATVVPAVKKRQKCGLGRPTEEQIAHPVGNASSGANRIFRPCFCATTRIRAVITLLLRESRGTGSGSAAGSTALVHWAALEQARGQR
jgi:hypothetical protein